MKRTKAKRAKAENHLMAACWDALAKVQHEGFDCKAFGRRLRAVRLALGLTEEQAAAAAGRTAETWRTYEALGIGRISEAVLWFHAKHPIDLRWLFTGDGRAPTALRLVHSAAESEREVVDPTWPWRRPQFKVIDGKD